jgi:GTP-binding protein HflX
VLADIGAQDVPQMLVFNKIDKLATDDDAKPILPRADTIDGGRVPRVWVSAMRSAGLDLLRDTLARTLQRERVHCWVHVPGEAGRLRARLFEQGLVASERDAEQGWDLEIDAPRALIEPLLGMPEGKWLRDQIGTENSSARTH